MDEEPDPIPWLDELLTRMRDLDPGMPAGWALAGEIRTEVRQKVHALREGRDKENREKVAWFKCAQRRGEERNALRTRLALADALADAVGVFMKDPHAACYPQECNDPAGCGGGEEKDSCEIVGMAKALAAYRAVV